jgi:hypothetical protein
VVEETRLLLREDQNSSRPVGKALEHRGSFARTTVVVTAPPRQQGSRTNANRGREVTSTVTRVAD